MRCGRLLLLLLAGVIAVLTPLAYASPPDPSWIRGLYDDADYDNVVALVTSDAGVVGPVSLSDLRPVPNATVSLAERDQASAPSWPLSANPSRAPPVA